VFEGAEVKISPAPQPPLTTRPNSPPRLQVAAGSRSNVSHRPRAFGMPARISVSSSEHVYVHGAALNIMLHQFKSNAVPRPRILEPCSQVQKKRSRYTRRSTRSAAQLHRVDQDLSRSPSQLYTKLQRLSRPVVDFICHIGVRLCQDMPP